jgi:hypothetical protein
VIRYCRHGAEPRAFLNVPEVPQRFFRDGDRPQMHHRLEKGEIRFRVSRTVERWKLKARLQAREIHRGSVQGFGEIGEGVHVREDISTPCLP